MLINGMHFVGTYSGDVLYLLVFRRWDMQSEAFRFEKSFEHIPEPPKLEFYIVLIDFNVKHCHLQKQMMFKFAGPTATSVLDWFPSSTTDQNLRPKAFEL